MSDEPRKTVYLRNAQQGSECLRLLYDWAKPWLVAGHQFAVKLGPLTRSIDQNAKFHAICSDIAKSGHEWAGKRRSAAQWKVLLVSGHAVATEEGAEMVPGLEGEFVNLRESTALMSIKRGASLIEYAISYAADNDIQLSDKEHTQ
jgi:hypothetical protein